MDSDGSSSRKIKEQLSSIRGRLRSLDMDAGEAVSEASQRRDSGSSSGTKARRGRRSSSVENGYKDKGVDQDSYYGSEGAVGEDDSEFEGRGSKSSARRPPPSQQVYHPRSSTRTDEERRETPMMTLTVGGDVIEVDDLRAALRKAYDTIADLLRDVDLYKYDLERALLEIEDERLSQANTEHTVSLLETRLADQSKEIEEARLLLKECEDTITRQDAELREAHSQMTLMSATCESLRASSVGSLKETEVAVGKLSSLNDELMKYRRLEEEWRSADADYRHRLEEFSLAQSRWVANEASYLAQMDALEVRLRGATAEASGSLSRDLKALEDRLAELTSTGERREAEMKSAFQRVSAQNESFEKENTKLRSLLKEAQATLVGDDREFASLRAERDAAIKAANVVAERASALAADGAAMEERVKNLEHLLDEKDRQLLSLKDSLEAADRDLKKLVQDARTKELSMRKELISKDDEVKRMAANERRLKSIQTSASAHLALQPSLSSSTTTTTTTTGLSSATPMRAPSSMGSVSRFTPLGSGGQREGARDLPPASPLSSRGIAALGGLELLSPLVRR